MPDIASGNPAVPVPAATQATSIAAAAMAAIGVTILTLITIGALFVSTAAMGLKLFGAPPMLIWAAAVAAGVAAVVVSVRFGLSAWAYERSH